MATSAEHLILRGLQLVIRATFSPGEEIASKKHFIALQRDIGPWLSDYVDEISKPVVDNYVADFDEPPKNNGGGGPLQ
jgi:hypothetical protein